MRNPFFKVICNRGNFTREMKNPFEFAKELLRYTRGELSKEEEKGIEQVLLEVKGMNTLVEELKDKDRIEYEMHIIAKFNTEKALSKLKNRKQVKKRNIILDCGSVCCGNCRSFCLDIVKPRTGCRQFVRNRKI